MFGKKKEVTIVDTVKLDGLTKGTKYQLKGWQMLKEENTELIIDGVGFTLICQTF